MNSNSHSFLRQSPSNLGFPKIESFFRNFRSNPDWRKTVERVRREAEGDSAAAEPEPEPESDNTEKREAVAEASRLDHVSVLPPPQDLPPAPHLPLFPPLGTAPPHPSPTPFPATSGHHVTISTPTHHISHGVSDHGTHHAVHKEHHQVHGHHGHHAAPLMTHHGHSGEIPHRPVHHPWSSDVLAAPVAMC